MLKNPLARCMFRLLTLAIMLGALSIFVSSERARAAAFEDCDTQYGYCIYDCRNKVGTEYEQCRAGCMLIYDSCFDNPNYDPLPAPYPVITHNLQWCLQGCAQCNQIQDVNDRLACSGACMDWCFANNPKP